MDQVKFGIFTPPRGLQWIYRTAELAEKLGNYDSVWMPDHLVGWGRNVDALDVWTTLTAVGLKTKNVKLGVGVTDPHRRHPSVLAHTAMTIERVVGAGRMMVGIGAGESMNLDIYGFKWDKPVSKLKEFVEIVKKLWTKKLVNYKGQYYNLKRAFISPKPEKIPIFIAGNRPRTRKITGELGDGWFPFKVDPKLYKKYLDEIKKAAIDAQRSPDEIVPGFLLYTVVSDDVEQARKIANESGRMLLMVSPNKIDELGFKAPTYKLDATKPLSRASMAEGFQKIKEIPFEAIEKIFIYGTADDCIEKISK
ncbi:MAG: LLM class flavin-dependent oxidoreductase, partial [Candidatus Helarchaeota archaeon]|nr:LLM class flavin-dependent oxidoreductase [Candidatus Helarchaeota archaeon]